MRRLTALAALFVALLAPSAEAQVVLGPGDQPNVTLDADGTAYIAWRGSGNESRRLFFCRLPRGATACAPQTELAPQGDSLTVPIAIRGAGSEVLLVSYRYGLTGANFAEVHLFRSADNGASFDGGTPIGTIAPWDLIAGPGGGISAITGASSCGTCYQRYPLDGGAVTTHAVLSGTHPYQGTVGLVDANTPLAVYTDGSANAQVRRWSGAGDLNDAGSWNPPVDIGTADYPHLAYGPSGVFLIARRQLSGGELQARKYDGTTFGAATNIGFNGSANDAVQDPSGRLHVVAQTYDNDGSIFYATSDDGVSWASTRIGRGSLPQDMRLAVAADHIGVVVGKIALGAGAGNLFASPIGPTAATPILGRSVVGSVVSGIVLVRRPGTTGFVRLNGTDVIPVGSVVDATKGRVRIAAAQPNGTQQTSDFHQGAFKLAQERTGMTNLTLFGGSFRGCPRSRAAAAKVRTVRKLWGDGSGRFRTKGRYATATLRGTRWYTADRCDGTLVRVTQGSVVVRDLRKRRSITLRAGRQYLARR